LLQSHSQPNLLKPSLEIVMDPSIHHLHHVNHWAILVSALILWLLGAVWSSPALFAKPWMAALGIVPTGPRKGLAAGMVASFIGDLLVALALLHFVVWSGAGSYGEGAFVGFLSWLGFFAATQLPQGIYEGRPFRLLVIGGLLAHWR
jgi:hypothetical protein